MKHSHCGIVFTISLLSCGGSTPPTQNVAVLPDAGTIAVTPPPKIEALGLPANAALVATFDLATVGLLGALTQELEQALDLAQGSLVASAPKLGFDLGRPASIAIAAASAEQRKVAEELRPLVAANTPPPASNGSATQPGTMDALKRVLALGSVSAMRILVPTSDAAKLEDTLGKLLKRDGFRSTAHGYSKSHTVIEMHDDGANVALDVAGGRSSREEIASLHEAMANAHDAPLPLEGRVMRIRFTPSALATFGFLQGLMLTAGALSGESIDASQRDRIAAQGLWEAGQLFELAGTSKGVYFESVEVGLRMTPFELTVREQPGPAFTMPPDDAWKPATSVALDGAWASVDGNRAFASARDMRKLVDMVRDGGFMGWFVALPQLLDNSALAFSAAFRTVAPDLAALAHFERFGPVWITGGAEAFVGILPATTTRAAAECALAPTTPCDAKAKLKLGGIVKNGAHRAKLVELDHRYVVVLSSDDAALGAKLTTRVVGPAQIDLQLGTFGALLKMSTVLPANVTGQLAQDGGALVFKMTAK